MRQNVLFDHPLRLAATDRRIERKARQHRVRFGQAVSRRKPAMPAAGDFSERREGGRMMRMMANGGGDQNRSIEKQVYRSSLDNAAGAILAYLFDGLR
jgi:hypothetical protein